MTEYKLQTYFDHRNELISEWPELPQETFSTCKEAMAAAYEFVGKFSGKEDGGGYDPEQDVWWARQSLGNERWRFTKIAIVSV